MNTSWIRSPFIASALLLLACSSGSDEVPDPTDSAPAQTETGSTETEATEIESGAGLLLVSRLDSETLLSSEVVSCTLQDGSSTTCHQLTFSTDVGFETGPYCPETTDDVGGLGIYDGQTNPGPQAMKAALWEAMEADGYDIVDDEGNVRVIDENSNVQPGTDGFSYCMNMPLDDALTQTYLIPVVPVALSTPHAIDSVEKLGVHLDGTALTGDPPSAVEGPGMADFNGAAVIPSLDPCGGHPDPAGYYHWHFVAENVNAVLLSAGITEVTCQAVSQDRRALVGYALDGYPVYASEDTAGKPDDLDSCNGHTGVTDDYPEGVYHYHASATDAPNMPPCLMGASAQNSFTLN